MAPRRIGTQRRIIRFLFGERSIERRGLGQQLVAENIQIRRIGELLRLLPARRREALIHGLFGKRKIVFGAIALAPCDQSQQRRHDHEEIGRICAQDGMIYLPSVGRLQDLRK